MTQLIQPARALVIGLDGATFDLLVPMAERGWLPNIGRAMQQGAAGVLRSTIPPLTAPAWSSFQTGLTPGRHGVFSFQRRLDHSLEREFVNSTAVHGPRLWHWLERSGLTTGVGMGRDDARAVGGLQGGTAPARAFSAFMSRAVADRPIEPFQTDVELPQWQLESEDDAYFGEPGEGVLTDENGMPVEIRPDTGPEAQGEVVPQPQLDEQWVDQMTGGSGSREDTPPSEPRKQFVPQREQSWKPERGRGRSLL